MVLDVERKKAESFGERLKDLRIKAGMRISEVAKQSGVSNGTISNYENGVTAPNFEILQKLAFTYKTPWCSIFGIEEADYKKDRDIFMRHGLCEGFANMLIFSKQCGAYQEVIDCLNLIYSDALNAPSLCTKLKHFFTVSYHEEVDRLPVKLPPRGIKTASFRTSNPNFMQYV